MECNPRLVKVVTNQICELDKDAILYKKRYLSSYIRTEIFHTYVCCTV